MKKLTAFLVLLISICSLSCCNAKSSFKCDIKRISGMGNVVLDLTGTKAKEQNIVPGDSLIINLIMV